MSLSIQTTSLSVKPDKYYPLRQFLNSNKVYLQSSVPQTYNSQNDGDFSRYALSYIPAAQKRLLISQFDDSGRLKDSGTMTEILLNSLKRDFQRTQDAIKKFHTIRDLTRECNIDGLTHVHNRRFFNSSLLRWWEDSLKENVPLTLILLDIDHFKKYNDTYGHQAGDNALMQVASAIKKSVRFGDVLARYGGEEFGLLLPNADGEAVRNILLRIQKNIADLKIAHSASDHGQITVSIGVATQRENRYENNEALLSAADKALYAAKDSGRNTMAYAGEEQNCKPRELRDTSLNVRELFAPVFSRIHEILYPYCKYMEPIHTAAGLTLALISGGNFKG